MNRDIEKIIERMIALRRSLFEQKEAAGKNISLLQLLSLKYIAEKEPIMRDVAKHFGITPPSATSLINTLSRSGFVSRKESSKDRRIVRIVLTASGKRELEGHQRHMTQEIGGKLKKLTEHERKQLLYILEKITH